MVAIVALTVVWPPVPGVRSSAIFVIVTAAVVAPPPVHLVTAVAAGAQDASAVECHRVALYNSLQQPRGENQVNPTRTVGVVAIANFRYELFAAGVHASSHVVRSRPPLTYDHSSCATMRAADMRSRVAGCGSSS